MPAQYPGGRFPIRICGIGRFAPKPKFKSNVFKGTFRVSGVTRDSAGTPLGLCTVKLFDTELDKFLKQTISDANGNYAFETAPGKFYYIVAYLAGFPDVEGTTVNTLVGI